MSMSVVQNANNVCSSKTNKHVSNVAITAGGVTATSYLCGKMGKVLSKSTMTDVTLKPMEEKLVNGFYKLGETLFGGKKINQLFENYEAPLKQIQPDYFKKAVKFNKASAAIMATGVAIASGFLANGIYKAGNINATK